MSIRDEIDSAVGAVLFNASNYPKSAMPHMLGQDIGPLREKVVEAVLASVQPPTREQIAEALTGPSFAGRELHPAQAQAIADAVLALFPQPAPSAEQTETLRQLACEGNGACRSPLHVHGCYADDGTACDEPGEHPLAEPVSIADIEQGVLDQISASRSAPLAPALQPNPGWNKRAEAEPSSIADMAPGTTDPFANRRRVRHIARRHDVIETSNGTWLLDWYRPDEPYIRKVDPSTIRDVTPPK